MAYKSDLYIFLPCVNNENQCFEITDCENANLFINELSQAAKYEFDSLLGENIDRRPIKEITLICKTDDRESPEFLSKEKAFITLSQYKSTDFCLAIITVPDVNGSLTHLLDQSSRRELVVSENSKEVKVSEWIKQFGIEITGKAFFASCISELPEGEEAKYIIAAEAYNKEYDFRIKSKEIDEYLGSNHAQYSHYDAYMSPFGIIYVVKDFADEYAVRLGVECIMIFILELVILKITAINTVNNDVANALSKRDPSLKEILKISEKFALSMPLWGIDRFRYLNAQGFANRVADSFKVSEYVEEYDKNQQFLEHIVNIRSLISAEKETKVISIVATILAILQVVPLLYSVILYLVEGNSLLFSQIVSVVVMSSFIMLALYLVFRRKKVLQKAVTK
jgi:hypothetical protein